MQVMVIKNENDMIAVYKCESKEDKDKALFDYFKGDEDYIQPSNPKILEMLGANETKGFYAEVMRDYLPNLNLAEYDAISIETVKEV
jgi:hypothetical protein